MFLLSTRPNLVIRIRGIEGSTQSPSILLWSPFPAVPSNLRNPLVTNPLQPLLILLHQINPQGVISPFRHSISLRVTRHWILGNYAIFICKPCKLSRNLAIKGIRSLVFATRPDLNILGFKSRWFSTSNLNILNLSNLLIVSSFNKHIHITKIH